MPTIRLAAGCAAVVLALLTGCAADEAEAPPGDTPAATTPAPTSPAPITPAPTTGPTGPTAQPQERALPVYYVVDTPAGLRLYREFHRVNTADPASDAVREMLASNRGLDPDYRSFWPAGASLHSPVRHAQGVITVDLSEQARQGSAGAALEAFSIQQLVYTVQGALQSTDPVQILIAGRRVEQLWGHVSVTDPIERADPLATRSLVQINDPNEGMTVPRTFTVTGEAAVFEATVLWEVQRDGQVVRSGFTNTTEAFRFSPFSFQLTLEPGEYTIVVTEDDPSGGEGRPPFVDTRRIRVQG